MANQSPLPIARHWGGVRTRIAAGMHVELRWNDLMELGHTPNGGYGLARHHCAVFTSFISCGMRGAVHSLNALVRNCSTDQLNTLHADIQGQSRSSALYRFLGIKFIDMHSHARKPIPFIIRTNRCQFT